MSPAAPVVPTSDTIHQMQRHMTLLLKWNESVNLTAIRDPLEILYRHFCESMFAASVMSLDSGRLADVGSGGGFPGLALKIIRPELEVFLVESNVKKATFLAEAVRDLDLTGARVIVSRYEDLGEELAPLDFACSRAVGEFSTFLKWTASPQIDAKQTLLWVGGRDLDEIRSLPSWEWREPIQLPQSLRRFLLVGTRKGE
jgi:16S rRNA (guanine527-N7)-methyltransferase